MSPGRGSGKWADADFPKRGWICEDVTDVSCGDNGCGCCRETCEMCEYMEIRYVHHMIHPDHGLALDTGCVCASRLELNRNAAEARERKLKNAASRRRNWLSRRWRVSTRGHHFLNTDGMNIVVYARASGWGGRIIERHSNNPRVVYSKRIYDTRDAAKLAAFNTMILLKERWGL